MRLVEVSNFEEALNNSWNKHYSDWPSKSFYVPPIYSRVVREAVEHVGHVKGTNRDEATLRVKRLQEKQIVENWKEEVFDKLKMLSATLQEQLKIFVICNIEIDATIGWLLRSTMSNNMLLPQRIKLDYVIFTSKCQIILIKFKTHNVADGVRDLNKGFEFIKQRLKVNNIPAENAGIIRVLFTKQSNFHNSNEIHFFSHVDNLCTWINSIILNPTTISYETLLPCLQTMAFIRATVCLKISEDVRLIESSLTEQTMLENTATQLAQAKITADPVHLKDAIAHVRLRKNRLYNLTPQQLELLANSKKTILVLGAAGTGKTIITKLKLLDHLRNCWENQEIGQTAVFVPENMIKEYEEFIRDNEPEILENFKEKLHFYSLSKNDFIENLKGELKAGASIFMDDSQHFYQFQRMFSLIKEWNSWRTNNPEQILFIALDWFQFLINGPLLVQELRIPQWLFPGAVVHLDFVMRNTKQIIKLASLIQIFIRFVFTQSNIPQDPIMHGIIEIEEGIEKWNPQNNAAARSSMSLQRNNNNTFWRKLKAPIRAVQEFCRLTKNSLSRVQPKANAVFSNAGIEGHKISGTPILLFTWNNLTNYGQELIKCSNKAVDVAIKELEARQLLWKQKLAIIYSASWMKFGLNSGLGKCSFAKNLAKFYSFQISSQEFMTVIFVLYVPEEFGSSIATKVTILSQIYQAITRAQTQLIIIADQDSIQRLKNVVNKFDELVTTKAVCDYI